MAIELVDNWKKFYKMFSFWFIVALGVAPDLFNLAVTQGLITGDKAPEVLAYTINIIAFIGAASRLVKQRALEIEATNS